MNPNDTNNQNINNSNTSGQAPEALSSSDLVLPTMTNADLEEANNNLVAAAQSAVAQPPVQEVKASPMPSTPDMNATPAPMPASPVVNTTPTQMPSPQANMAANSSQATQNPNANIPPVNMSAQAPITQNTQNVEVINTKKVSSSNIGVFIIAILLILFIFNVDRLASLYDKYMVSSSLTTNNNSSDNLSSGYIQIGEASSSKKVNDITFNNFKKAGNNLITFNYNSAYSYEVGQSFGIYIELYDSSKQLLYRTSFIPVVKIDKDTTSQYEVSLPNDKLYSDSYYANVAVLSNGSTKTLVCTSTKDNFNYRNEYTFSNDMLTSYEISKEYTGEEEDKTLETEFASLDASYNATYQNNVLKYTVNANLSGAEYTNGVSSYFVKSGQEAKEWKCE